MFRIITHGVFVSGAASFEDPRQLAEPVLRASVKDAGEAMFCPDAPRSALERCRPTLNGVMVAPNVRSNFVSASIRDTRPSPSAAARLIATPSVIGRLST